jgi:hypothetical protein
VVDLPQPEICQHGKREVAEAHGEIRFAQDARQRAVVGALPPQMASALGASEHHRVDARRRRRRAHLSEVVQRLVPHLATERVVGHLLDVLGEPVGVHALDGADHPAVQRAPALLQQAAVHDLVRERVLERVLEVGEELGLVHELRGLEPAEPAPQLVLR